MQLKMKLLFYLSKKRINSISEAPIYCRITMDNERCEISTSLFVKLANFENGFVSNTFILAFLFLHPVIIVALY